LTNKPLPSSENTSPAVKTSVLSHKTPVIQVDLGEGMQDALYMGTCMVKHDGTVVMVKVLFVMDKKSAVQALKTGQG